MNELILIDCMKFMKTLPDNYFDLAIVDPPYGIGDFNNKKTKKKKHNKEYKINWNRSAPNEQYFNELKRISKNHIIFGFQFYMKYLWDELNGVIIHDFGSTGGFGSDCDLAITNLQQRVIYFKYRWQGFIRENKEDTDKNRIHPCEKPTALYKWLLKNYAKPGDKLFDSHSGSGSFRIAAHDMGFDLTSCEIDEDYYRDNEKRFQNHIKQNDLFAPEELQESMLQMDL